MRNVCLQVVANDPFPTYIGWSFLGNILVACSVVGIIEGGKLHWVRRLQDYLTGQWSVSVVRRILTRAVRLLECWTKQRVGEGELKREGS